MSHTMECSAGQWSPENMIRLLELYKEEPCLWDPRVRSYKHRSTHLAAWNRIIKRLPFYTTVDEAKKKNSLMGYYRIHLKRYKKTLAITGGRGHYNTTWFAFELMHSFLYPIYGPNKKLQTSKSAPAPNVDKLAEVKLEPLSASDGSESPEDVHIVDFKKEFLLDTNDEQLRAPLYANENENEKLLKTSLIEDDGSSRHSLEKNGELPETSRLSTEKVDQINLKNRERMRDGQCKRDQQYTMDEYDHFGFLIASKIRKISSSPEREILMHSINNLLFETYMKCRKNNSQET